MLDVYQDGKTEWRWRVIAGNGKIVADSAEGYKRKCDCLTGAKIATTLLVNAGINGHMLEEIELIEPKTTVEATDVTP
jgi:uncharacterized protein YegP (UPF0339 family)